MLGKPRTPESPLVRWPGAEVWGVSSLLHRFRKKFGPDPHWDSWHDYHHVGKRSFHPGIQAKRPETLKWYRSLPGPNDPGFRPVYLLEHDPTIPASVRMPREEIAAAFPIAEEDNRNYFSCQLDWMLCWSIMLGFEHIVLSGHGTRPDPLHFAQHRGPLFWIGFARARGIRVDIVPPSWYLAPEKPYGTESGAWEPPPPKRR